MFINIKKYIEKIKNFNLLDYSIKKRIGSLQYSKKTQEGMILFFKKKIENNKIECRKIQEKIKHSRMLITGYKDILRKLNVVVELYEDK